MVSLLRSGLPALFLLACAGGAQAALFTVDTDEHPNASNFTLSLGVAGTPIIDGIGPTPVQGTAVLDLDLTDPDDSGTMTINSMVLNIQTIGPETLNLGAFGTVDVQLLNIIFELSGGPFTVTNNNFSITSSDTGTLGFTGGSLVLTNATGFLAAAAGVDPDDIDFDADPEITPFADLLDPLSGTVDDDDGLVDADGAELNLPFIIPIDVGSGLYLQLDANFNLGSAIPEAGTFTLLGLAGCGVAGFAGMRRYRRRS